MDLAKVMYEIDLTAPRLEPDRAPVATRPLRSGDRSDLARLMLDAYVGTIDYEGESLDEALGEVDDWYAGTPLVDHSFGVEVEGELAAALLAMAVDGEPFVAIVMTAAAHKGMGLGRAVVQAALASLGRAGHPRVTLAITNGNTASERLFLAAGAVPVGGPIAVEPGALGVVADIHGNPYALAEVLRDGAERGVDRWLVLGDVVAMGPEPVAVLDRLADQDVVAAVRGNTERYVLTGNHPGPTAEQLQRDPALTERLIEVAASMAWTRGYLTATDRLTTIGAYQPLVRLALPDATMVTAVHASLGRDDGPGITPETTAEELRRLVPPRGARLVLGGHTHAATDVEAGGVRYVNPGSVSNHPRPDLGACYGIVRVTEADHRVELHEVAYDKTRIIDAIRSSGVPGAGFVLPRYFGLDR